MVNEKKMQGMSALKTKSAAQIYYYYIIYMFDLKHKLKQGGLVEIKTKDQFLIVGV